MRSHSLSTRPQQQLRKRICILCCLARNQSFDFLCIWFRQYCVFSALRHTSSILSLCVFLHYILAFPSYGLPCNLQLMSCCTLSSAYIVLDKYFLFVKPIMNIFFPVETMKKSGNFDRNNRYSIFFFSLKLEKSMSAFDKGGLCALHTFNPCETVAKFITRLTTFSVSAGFDIDQNRFQSAFVLFFSPAQKMIKKKPTLFSSH